MVTEYESQGFGVVTALTGGYGVIVWLEHGGRSVELALGTLG